MEDRTTSAILWFRRAIASNDPDAKLDLAKLLLKNPSGRKEAQQLLESFVSAGPQPTFTYGVGKPLVPIEDEDFEEGKRLLRELKNSINV